MKKLIIPLLVAAALAVGPVSAQAAPKSYYDWAVTLQTSQQHNFATQMIKIYERSAKTYENFLVRFKRFSHLAFYKTMQENYNFYGAEIEKYKALINKTEDKVTVTKTEVETKTFNTVTRSEPTLKTEDTAVVEERTDTTVYEYAVVTKVFSTTVKTITATSTYTYTYYSDGTKNTAVTTKVDGVVEKEELNTEVQRELIREYAIVVPVEEAPTDSTQTVNVLTEEEYLARPDVDLALADVYRNAVWKMNANINGEYIDTALKPYANSLIATGAPTAWSRGYTGKGSTIAILDTGIDVDHSEFAGRITAMECFTAMCKYGYETIDDLNRYSHGTHVAGIAAAALDGVGTTGVAPDANLLIAKTAYNGGYFDFQAAAKAITWAANNDAVAINISANYNVDTTYKNSMVEIKPGLFRSTDTRGRDGITYDNYGYSNLLDSPYYYKNVRDAMKGHEAVLVLAAGNQGLDFAGQPGFMALDPEVGNRVLIVGNYDLRTQTIARTSNKAGTVCYDFNATTNTCNSEARISDHYLMAPGQYVAATDSTGEYRTNSGTSMAAPHVTGAVAIVHQMWPHMTGENLAKLLLNTASKDIPNYDVNVHGQGLLDLAEATTPQGAVGLPTTGRVNGAKVEVAGGTLAMSGSASISALTEVMVVDAYDRDFYFDATKMVQVNDTRTVNPVLAAQAGVTPDNYLSFTNGVVLPSQNFAVSINEQTHDIAVAQKFGNVTVGFVNEQGKFLNNIADSSVMRVTGATTAYVGYGYDNGMLFGNAQLGLTNLNVDTSSYLKEAGLVTSYSATAGIKQTVGKSTFGFVASLPVTIADGSLKFNMPTSVTANGDIVNSDVKSNLRSVRQEIDYGLFYNNQITKAVSLDSFVELRTNYAGSTEDAVQAGVNLKVTF